MPSSSKKQHNFMAAVAHGMKPKGGGGPSPAQAKEFIAADAKQPKFAGAAMRRDGRTPKKRVASKGGYPS
jgi:hypothetical protein